ncbi:MAG: leucine-rich repeat domain-containing protein, partial [Clostridia bacterium]|nr:leucine-rich repeat domain-containing protein [Clostridia bacterium]
SVTIPSTVATIELNAFKSCGNLTSLLFAETPEGQDAVDLTFVNGEASGSSYNMTINSIFSGCSNLKEIQLPERTKYIGKYAFSNLGLETINIPASVTTIGENAFYKCKKLTEVTFSEGSQLTAIAKHTFNLCSALTTINVPASVTAISELAFEGCASLANVTLNEGLTTIGSQAFAGTAIKSLAIPASVTTIGASAFEKCVDLATVTFAENSALTTIDEYAFGDCKVLSTITIPASVTKIGMAAFICCEKLATVNFAQGESKLTEIDSNAFASSGVTNFTFPETAGTLTFGEAMFEGCALNTVHLSSQISSITGIFDGATVENITVAETSVYFSAVEGQKVLFNKNGDAIAIVYGEFVGALDLSTVVQEGKNLTQIGENAFKDQTKITSIVVPATVQEIGDYAFQGCTALTSVTFVSEGGQLSALNTIGKQAFDGCSALTEIKLPENVTSLGEKAFYNCSSLTNIEINKNLTTIGNYAFANAKQVKTLVIPEGVKTIGNYMFDYLGAEVEEGAITAITLPTT